MSDKISTPNFKSYALSFAHRNNCLDVAIIEQAMIFGYKLAAVNVKVQLEQVREDMNEVRRIANGPQ